MGCKFGTNPQYRTTGTLGTPTDTVTYTYGDSEWGDLLTAYDGKPITYDTIGNPLNDGTWSYTWQHGRQLASMSKGNTTWTNTYDANGMRTMRSDGCAQGTYTYIYNGSKLSQMIVEGYTFSFTYDASGTPLSFTMDGTLYYYETNLQGDVIGIIEPSGNRVVSYAYDAWGNVQITTNHQMAMLNPLLYRGYVYDWETGLYYLQSRYYDPEIGRFLNADAFASTGQGLLGNNMFTYCSNNPITGYDPNGMWNWGGFWAGVAITIVGVFSIAAIVMTAGTAAPAVATAVVALGTPVAAAITSTGAVTAYAAATEQTAVYDVSVVDGSTHDKQGVSIVIDFETDSATIETYYHYGKTTSGYSASYGTGIVSNYEKAGDYGGYFIDGGVTYAHNGIDYGIDICTAPSEPFNLCSAVLFTVGVSFPATKWGKFGIYGGVDYYLLMSYLEW